MHLSHHHAPILRTERAAREGGYVMAMFGLLLVPLLLMAGLAVDVGSWYNRASDIQKAADAASLAGVVWLPDVTRARQVALEVAAKNGFDNADPDIVVTVNPSTKSPRRLGVTIQDLRVGSFFYSNVGGSDIDLTRGSFAEYVTPVPMGSPRNFFGLGSLATPGGPERLFQSVNPYCTDKVQGDRKQSRYLTATCSGALNDPDYTASGYELYIDAVPGRPAPIEIRLYDPRYNAGTLTTVIPNPPTCPPSAYVWNASYFGPENSTANVTITGPMQYQTRANSSTSTYAPMVELLPGQTFTFVRNRIRYRAPDHTYPSSTSSGWTGPSSSSAVLTVTGPVQYQTRSNSSTNTWSGVTTLATGGSYSLRGDRLRYRSPTYTASECENNDETINEGGVDMTLANSNGERYTYSLFGADNTPLDDTDNPLLCSKSFEANTAFDGYEYLTSRRWNTLPVSNTVSTACTIPTTALSGKYILRVQNRGAVGNNASGANQYGVVARYTNASGDGLCDGRTDALCPRVYGKEFISVYAKDAGATASFYLAEIGPEHAGKKLKLELWDPGEGGNNIQIMRPTGANSWTPVNFSWKVGTGPVTTTNTLDVTGSVFNGRLVEITVDLTGYAPPTNNNWWQIKYQFTSGATVTDRTTWSARIVGDPVHLIEEN